MRLPQFLRTPPPEVVVEITPRYVAAIDVSGSLAAGLRVVQHAVEPLPAGVVTPALNAMNVARPDELAQSVARALTRLGRRTKSAALVVPDGIAKVSFVRFQQVPARASDLEELIKFQIRKSAPFQVEDSRIAYSKGMETAEGQEFVVMQARRDVVEEYEAACRAAGATIGLVDLATFNVANVVIAGDPTLRGDWLLVNVAAGGAALSIHRGRDVAFFRHRLGDSDGQLGDLVHQTAMFYQDRLAGSGFTRVLVAGGSQADGPQSARQTIEARLGRTVEAVDPLKAVGFADRASLSPELADALTPAIGLAVAQRTDATDRDY